MLTLKQCTKAELLRIIERLSASSPWYVELLLNEISSEREEARFSRAKQLSQRQREIGQELEKIMAQYEGQPISKVPLDVLKRWDELTREDETVFNQYMRVMGIKKGCAK